MSTPPPRSRRRTVVYTDSPAGRIGFATVGRDVALSPAGVLDLPGEPTSVDVLGRPALVAVDTSESSTAPSGLLVVVGSRTRSTSPRWAPRLRGRREPA